MSDRTAQIIVVVVGLLVGLDLLGAAYVSVHENRVPQVLGDVAKVGTGALAGALTFGLNGRRSSSSTD